MNAKKIIALISVLVILAAGVYAVIDAYNADKYQVYQGDFDTKVLLEDPTAYDDSEATGISDIIVKQNVEKTMAANNVAAIVFDFRGFDTLGESFILLTSIAGAYVILSVSKKKKKEDNEQ